jgi:hypothetical protein
MEIPIDPSYIATAGGYYATAYVPFPFHALDYANAFSLWSNSVSSPEIKKLASSAPHGSALNSRTAGLVVAGAVALVTLGAGW